MSERQDDWKGKFNGWVNTAQVELKKTTQIGIKLFSASQSNSLLHEKLEALGTLCLEAIKSGELKWENEKVQNLTKEITDLKEQLKNYEQEVKKIKKK